MRLLNVSTKQLHTFYGDSIPPYAILSHTWLADDAEVTFAHLQAHQPEDWSHLPGAKKIQFTCQQAANDGHTWAWIDTCCIDKTNNAELSEAINSMFRWYQRSDVCYVYLSDYDIYRHEDLFVSRWWTRAWTLQELVAPECVRFFDAHWEEISTKSNMADDIAKRMSIDEETLRDAKVMYSKTVAQRMSWAAHRQATREEDLAYSLLGIFNINMTMQYGEGERAFVRLQEEITRTTADMSVFAWGFSPRYLEDICSGDLNAAAMFPNLAVLSQQSDPGQTSKYGIYADSPRRFSNTQDITHHACDIGDLGCDESRGIQSLKTMVISWFALEAPFQNYTISQEWSLALLPCIIPRSPHALVGILLRRYHHNSQGSMRYCIKGDVYSCLVRSEHLVKVVEKTVKINTRENQLSQKAIDGSKLNRTLVVKIDEIEDYPFQFLKPTEWLPNPYDSNRFTMLNDEKWVETILCFQHREAPVSVYVGFIISEPNESNSQAPLILRNRCVIRAVPSRTTTEQIRRAIHDALVFPNMAEAMVSRVCARSTCKHDRLTVITQTHIVFGQALTTLTLTQWDNSLSKDLPAVCVKPKDRLPSS